MAVLITSTRAASAPLSLTNKMDNAAFETFAEDKIISNEIKK